MCSSNEGGGVTGVILISKFQKKQLTLFLKLRNK